VSSANNENKRKRGLEDADCDRIPENPYQKRYRKSVRHVGARTAAGAAARTSGRTGGGDDRDREGRAILRTRVGGARTPLSPPHNRQGGKYARNFFGAGFSTRAHCVDDRGCRDRKSGGPGGNASRACAIRVHGGSRVRSANNIVHRKSVLTPQQRTYNLQPRTRGDASTRGSEGASDSLNSRWMSKYAQLQAFKHQHKHVHVPTSHSGLGVWVKNQREKARDCTLRPERKQMLSELGFCFDGVEASRLRRHHPVTHPWEKESMRVVRGGLSTDDNAASAVQEGSHYYPPSQPWPRPTSLKPGPSSLPKDHKSCTRLSESFDIERESEAGCSKGQEGGGAAAGASFMRERLLSFAPPPPAPLSDPPPPVSDASQASKYRLILVAKKTVTYLYYFCSVCVCEHKKH